MQGFVGRKMSDTFLYFGYGSNLLRQRIRIQNPSAVFKTIGKLEGHMLSFGWFNSMWKGSVATVVRQEERHLWGTVWELNNTDMPNLDKQEGVEHGIYKPIEVEVKTPVGEVLKCRSYQLIESSVHNTPSPHYKEVILRGAIQNKLPEDYIEELKRITDNGFKGEVEVYKTINFDLE